MIVNNRKCSISETSDDTVNEPLTLRRSGDVMGLNNGSNPSENFVKLLLYFLDLIHVDFIYKMLLSCARFILGKIFEPSG